METKRIGEPRLTIRVTVEVHKKLKRLAIDRETSVQGLLTPIIESIVSGQSVQQ